jgi:hypothetical protein
LCHYLRQHPDVFVAREKESHHFLFQGTPPHFVGPGDEEEFNPLVISDRDRYLQCFADAERFLARGEASVYYLYRSESLERALAFDPTMKFVAVLRNPVDRAFSAWAHMIRDGREPQSDFLAALAAEPDRARQGWSYGFSYESVGCYGRQLEDLRRVVPADQLHVLLYDDLVEDPDGTLSSLFAFLGVPDAAVNSSLVMNASGRPRLRALNSLLTRRNPVKETLKKVLPYELGSNLAHRLRNWNLQSIDLDGDTSVLLHQRFRDDIELAAEQIGRDLSCWAP